jgi:hypothetical protein
LISSDDDDDDDDDDILFACLATIRSYNNSCFEITCISKDGDTIIATTWRL